jgi:ADP-ribosylglycohydrolase
MMPNFSDRVAGALYGVAAGDAMGAPVEGMMPARIAKLFPVHDWNTFLPPTHGGDPSTGKGAGRVTDDTLMVEALIEAYCDARRHLDAHGYAGPLLRHVYDEKVWVPERAAVMRLWDRLWWPEKYPWMRIVQNNVEPRVAGIGNCVNCGVAMWMMPVGAVNAGDPEGAYQEAAALGAAHNESFAVEAGAVMAAAYAEAFAAGATVRSVLRAAGAVARDGTANAICDVVSAVRPRDGIGAFIRRVRSAVSPYDQREGHVPDDKPLLAAGINDVGRPSKTHAIEELPVALAALAYGGGKFRKTIEAAVRYGRDCDSIASMATGLFGALYGVDAVPASLRRAVDAANRRDFAALARRFCAAVRKIRRNDVLRERRRAAAVRP